MLINPTIPWISDEEEPVAPPTKQNINQWLITNFFDLFSVPRVFLHDLVVDTTNVTTETTTMATIETTSAPTVMRTTTTFGVKIVQNDQEFPTDGALPFDIGNVAFRIEQEVRMGQYKRGRHTGNIEMEP